MDVLLTRDGGGVVVEYAVSENITRKEAWEELSLALRVSLLEQRMPEAHRSDPDSAPDTLWSPMVEGSPLWASFLERHEQRINIRVPRILAKAVRDRLDRENFGKRARRTLTDLLIQALEDYVSTDDTPSL